MQYQLKNRIFHVIGKLPQADSLHYLLQKYGTHSLQLTDDQRRIAFAEKVQCHLNAFAAYGETPLQNSTYYEFGSGWDLFAALGFAAAGMQTLHCIDLRAHIHASDIRNAAAFYRRNAGTLHLKKTLCADPLPKRYDALCRTLRERYGICYQAPCDARHVPLQDGSVDYIVSNRTLEHILQPDILPILLECKRLLKPGGILSVTIDYQDHWSYTDSSISIYNFLSFSDAEWQKRNPDLHYQNRLRHSDYQALFAETGLTRLKETPLEIRQKDREAVKTVPLSEPFRGYAADDLLIRGAHFILQKQSERI